MAAPPVDQSTKTAKCCCPARRGSRAERWICAFAGTAALVPHREGSVAFALHSLAQELAVTPHRFGLFARPPLRRLLVIAAQLHFSEHPFALHFLLQGAERLIDVVVANEDLHGSSSPSGFAAGRAAATA